jgi:hypothetical protein
VKRRSARRSSTSSPGPPEPVFFVDADLGDKLFHETLAKAGVRFERHDDHFAAGTADLDWLRKAGEQGWIVLSHNKEIRRTSAETERLMEAGVRAFLLIGTPYRNPPGRKSAFALDLATNLIRTMPAILRFLRRYPAGPWIAKLYRPPPHTPGEPGDIRMWLTFQAWLKGR